MSGKQPKCLQCCCYDSRWEPFLELFRTRCARGASLKIENLPMPCPVGHRDKCKKTWRFNEHIWRTDIGRRHDDESFGCTRVLRGKTNSYALHTTITFSALLSQKRWRLRSVAWTFVWAGVIGKFARHKTEKCNACLFEPNDSTA